jgi:hypothetical protein
MHCQLSIFRGSNTAWLVKSQHQVIIKMVIHWLVPNLLIFIIKMCYYINQSFYYSKYRAQPRHIESVWKWDECDQAKKNGHYCPDTSPAKDLSRNVIVTGSSKRPGECPQYLPLIGQVSWVGKTLAIDLTDMHYWSNLQHLTQPTNRIRETAVRRKGNKIDWRLRRRVWKQDMRCFLIVAIVRFVRFAF